MSQLPSFSASQLPSFPASQFLSFSVSCFCAFLPPFDEALLRIPRIVREMRDHRQLRVWQRASALSVAVYRGTELLDGNVGARHYQMQLRRAVASIPANIAEGHGQQSAAQFARYLSNSTGSIAEALSHCAEMRSLSLLSDERAKYIDAELTSIRGMVLSLRRYVQAKARSANKLRLRPQPSRENGEPE